MHRSQYDKIVIIFVIGLPFNLHIMKIKYLPIYLINLPFKPTYITTMYLIFIIWKYLSFSFLKTPYVEKLMIKSI